jgi:DNA processing protein
MMPPVTDAVLDVNLALSTMSFLHLPEKQRLALEVGRAEEFVPMTADDFSLRLHRKVQPRLWEPRKLMDRIHLARKAMEMKGIAMVAYESEGYPKLLAAIFDPPFLIFVRGDQGCLGKPGLSVVGSRKASIGGMRSAKEFARDAAAAGETVVSGLAFGIDACAHNGALEAAEGKTAAVLAGGLDAFTPAANSRIGARILDHGGAVLSEYLPGTSPEPWRFVQRNRIVAGLTRATVVIDAPGSSGALITAKFALEEGRDVYIHRVSLDKAGYEQVNRLVEEGAPVIDGYPGVAALEGTNNSVDSGAAKGELAWQ